MAPLQALLLLAAVTAVSAGASMFGQRFTGDGTYYGYRTRGFGHCSFHFHGFGDSPAYVGTPLAINAAQYTGTSVCGMCVKFKGLGRGAGGNPIASSFGDGFICDQCPECNMGDLDLQKGGDGRWKIEWYPVQCPVGDSKLRFGFQGGNPWYRKIMVANARVPVSNVMMWDNYGSKWKPLIKTIDNYWEYHGDVGKDFAGGAKLQITSIFGDTIKDTLTCTSGTCSGSAQFPCRSDIGEGANCGAGGFNVNVDVFGVNLKVKAGSGGVGASVTTPFGGFGAGFGGIVNGYNGVGRDRTRGFANARLPSDDAAAKSSSSSSNSANERGRVIQRGGQCGGLKFDCAKFGQAQCADKPFGNAQCARGLKCVRNDANWWGCKRA